MEAVMIFGLVSTITMILVVILSIGWCFGNDGWADAREAFKILATWLLIASVILVFWSVFVKWFFLSYLPGLFF